MSQGDRTLLGQVLANLIENAMHHTLQGTRITVALSQSETHVDLSVTDNGPGIPEADPSKIAAQVTREVADRLAALGRSFEGQGHEPEAVARFLMWCLFTMFAEDRGRRNFHVVRSNPKRWN
jgi:signal transduction histidine kinase